MVGRDVLFIVIALHYICSDMYIAGHVIESIVVVVHTQNEDENDVDDDVDVNDDDE